MTATTRTESAFQVIPAHSRGRTDLGWLKSDHSFSFGQYQSPSRTAYHALRVINDDVVEAGKGFGEHPHHEMEILTWVLEGSVKHKDSTGNQGEILPGDLQIMSAGTGIHHSEMNGQTDTSSRFLQIWIQPSTRRVDPRYQQRSFESSERTNRWQLLASPDQSEGSLHLNADARVSVTTLTANASINTTVGKGRFGYLQIARGNAKIGDLILSEGDGAEFAGGQPFEIQSDQGAEILLFDLV
ncbi:MAG: pirin family protein [Phycisphaerales bacterium]